MFNASRFPTLLPVLMMLGCATSPSGGPYDSPIGKWQDTHENQLGATKTSSMTVVDDKRATYSGSPPGRILFFDTTDPRIWKGYWISDSGRNKCTSQQDESYFWGVQVFEFNEDYTRYSGYWDICGEGHRFSSNGNR